MSRVFSGVVVGGRSDSKLGLRCVIVQLEAGDSPPPFGAVVLLVELDVKEDEELYLARKKAAPYALTVVFQEERL